MSSLLTVCNFIKCKKLLSYSMPVEGAVSVEHVARLLPADPLLYWRHNCPLCALYTGQRHISGIPISVFVSVCIPVTPSLQEDPAGQGNRGFSLLMMSVSSSQFLYVFIITAARKTILTHLYGASFFSPVKKLLKILYRLNSTFLTVFLS